jgi:uncharacterized protein (DUF1810 family)
MHLLPLEERIEKKICSSFRAIFYDVLIGELDQNERDILTNVTYNSPKNLYGDVLSVLLVSDIAYFGVSFYSTNNIIMLSRVSNIAKWQQIYTRIIRLNSHAMLPSSRRYAKVYTYALSQDMQYYHIRILYHRDIQQFMRHVAEISIMHRLLENPSTLPHAPILHNVFIEDVNDQLHTIVRRIFRHAPMRVWRKDIFVQRIRDSSIMLTFLNLSALTSQEILGMLMSSKMIRIFEYAAPSTPSPTAEQHVEYVTLRDTASKIEAKKFSTFSFSQLDHLDTRTNALQQLVASLSTMSTIGKKLKTIGRIIYVVGKKYILLAERQAFWDAIYDICDEYYDDDETNFFANHAERNPNKMTGMYYGNIIILRNGEIRTIHYHFPQIDGIPTLPYVFRITCLVLSETSAYNIHLTIMRKASAEDDNIIDQRKRSKGIICTSFDKEKLQLYYPSATSSSLAYCMELMLIVIRQQAESPDTRFVYSPFEK